jgi:hypothetical protein
MRGSIEKILKLVQCGGPIAGAATGGALGFLSGGPIGAAFGAGLGDAIGQVIEDAAERQLSQREKVRVGAAAAYAASFVAERLSKGDFPREDGFFGNTEFNLSAAVEIFDGVLTNAKGDHEERKARFYGHFFANVAFDPTCSRSEANYFLSVLERLTYYQLVIVSLFWDASRFPNLPQHDLENRSVPASLLHVLSSVFDLCQTGVLKLFVGNDGAEVLLDITAIIPARMGLSTTGERLFSLASLHNIPLLELTELAQAFAAASWRRESHADDIVLRDVTALRNK